MVQYSIFDREANQILTIRNQKHPSAGVGRYSELNSSDKRTINDFFVNDIPLVPHWEYV